MKVTVYALETTAVMNLNIYVVSVPLHLSRFIGAQENKAMKSLLLLYSTLKRQPSMQHIQHPIRTSLDLPLRCLRADRL